MFLPYAFEVIVNLKVEIPQFKAINRAKIKKSSSDWTVNFSGSIPKTLIDISRRQLAVAVQCIGVKV